MAEESNDVEAGNSQPDSSVQRVCDIFLCHSSVDKTWVRMLAERITRETWKGRQFSVFFDEWNISGGYNIISKIDEHLKKCRFVAVILSPDLLVSDWATMEWTSAVVADPSGKRGHVIPVLLRDCDIPATLRMRHYLDFRRPEDFNHEFARLITILKGEAGKTQEEITQREVIHPTKHFAFPIVGPDPITETILTNIFPVRSFPKEVWSGSTLVKGSDFFRLLSTRTSAAVLLQGSRAYTFVDIQNNPEHFKDLVNLESVKSEAIGDWLESKRHNLFIALFNQCLRVYCNSLDLEYDKRHRKYYFRPEKGGPRFVRWLPHKRFSRLEVVKRFKIEDDVFWEHKAAQLEFKVFDEKPRLVISPGWKFTKDGSTDLSPAIATRYYTRKMHTEYNSSYLNAINFWVFYLSRKRKVIDVPTGTSPIKVSSRPLFIQTDVGISWDQDKFPTRIRPLS